jgi:hypothetical protein
MAPKFTRTALSASLESRVVGFGWVKGGRSPAQRTLDAPESASTLQGSGQAKPCGAWLPSPSGGEDLPALGGGLGVGDVHTGDVFGTRSAPRLPTQTSGEPIISFATGRYGLAVRRLPSTLQTSSSEGILPYQRGGASKLGVRSS